MFATSWAHRAEEGLAILQRFHPHFQPQWTIENWYMHVRGAFCNIPGICRLCGLEIQGTIQNLINNKQSPGSAIEGVPHDCAQIAKGVTLATRLLEGTTHVLIDVQLLRHECPVIMMEPGGCGRVMWKKQRYATAITRCQTCNRKCSMQVRAIADGHAIACWCNNVGIWQGDEGYFWMIRIIRRRRDICHYEAAFTLQWWRENVVNNNTKIPMACTDCREKRYIRLSSIQSGNGVGCACTQRGAQLLKDFLQAEFLDVPLRPEPRICQNPATGKWLAADFAMDFPKATIYVELDGQQHFSCQYDGHEDLDYATRDLTKELEVCKKGQAMIRLTQNTLWRGNLPWKDFLRTAVATVLAQNAPHGCIIHQNLPCYLDQGFYASVHRGSALAAVHMLGTVPLGRMRQIHKET